MGFFSKIIREIKRPFKQVVELFQPEIPEFQIPQVTEPSVAAETTREGSQGVLLNFQSSIAPIPVVYGERKVGVIRVMVQTSGSDNEYLYIAGVICEGEISSIDTIWIDDTLSTDPKFTGLISIGHYIGADDQAAHPIFVAAGIGWTQNHRLQGVAYLAMRFKWDREVFRGVPNVHVKITGRKVVSANHQGTRIYENNPADVLWDYMVNKRFGMGLPASALNAEKFKAARTIALNQIPDGFGGGTVTRFRMNYFLDTQKRITQNIKEILQGSGGMIPFSGGKYGFVIEDTKTSSAFSFDEDNMIGGLRIHGVDKSARFNRVIAIFTNPDRNWQEDQVEYPLAGSKEAADYLAADNGLPLETTVRLPTVTARSRAFYIARRILIRSRSALRVDFTATPAAMKLEVGDLVEVTHATPAWSAKNFIVVGLTVTYDALVNVSLREYDASVYDSKSNPPPDATPSPTLPDPQSVAAPTSLALASGTAVLGVRLDGTIFSRIKATWTAPVDALVTSGGVIEVQFKKNADATWLDGPVLNGATAEVFILDVDDGVAYDVRIRAVNSAGFPSSYLTVSNHTVAGKSAAPADVTNYSAQQNGNVVTHRWDQVTDLDLAGYELRYMATPFTWADANPLTSITKGTLVTNTGLPPGAWVCGIKAVDTSGNYSATAATFSITVSNTNNIILSVQEDPRWIGTLSNLVRHDVSGRLVPASTDADSTGDNQDVFDSFVLNPETTCEFTAKVKDMGFAAEGVRCYSEIGAALGPGETAGDADPSLSIDLDGGGFQPWTVGTVDARLIKFKQTILPASGVAYLDSVKNVMDVLDRTEKSDAGGVTVAVSGTAITFSERFHLTPVVKVSAIGSTALFAIHTAPTVSGFTAYIFNSAGTDVGGTITWEARGA